MPKRLRSEEEGFSSCGLLKNHISEREVNSGVLQQERMKSVYEKTLALLYRGSRNVANNNALTQVLLPALPAPSPPSPLNVRGEEIRKGRKGGRQRVKEEKRKGR